MTYYIEYSSPPLRDICYTAIMADNEEDAIKLFQKNYPNSQIRNIKEKF